MHVPRLPDQGIQSSFELGPAVSFELCLNLAGFVLFAPILLKLWQACKIGSIFHESFAAVMCQYSIYLRWYRVLVQDVLQDDYSDFSFGSHCSAADCALRHLGCRLASDRRRCRHPSDRAAASWRPSFLVFRQGPNKVATAPAFSVSLTTSFQGSQEGS